MKNVVISTVIFCFMVFVMIFSINYLNKICFSLDETNIKLEQLLEKNDWQQAYTTSLNLLNDWNNHSYIVSIFIHHAEIDNINNELWKLSQYVKCKNKDESLASVHVIKFLLHHIVNMEKVNIQNLF